MHSAPNDDGTNGNKQTNTHEKAWEGNRCANGEPYQSYYAPNIVCIGIRISDVGKRQTDDYVDGTQQTEWK